MISSALSGSKRGISVRQPPATIVAFSPQVWPKEWKSGSAPRIIASPSIPNSSTATSAFLRMLAWVSSAPFGVPVVPEV